MVDAKDLYASAFKVVTERARSHLMGRVTQREANRAMELTRSGTGGCSAWCVLEIISEDELQRMLPQEPPPASTPPKPEEAHAARLAAPDQPRSRLDEADVSQRLPPACCTSP